MYSFTSIIDSYILMSVYKINVVHKLSCSYIGFRAKFVLLSYKQTQNKNVATCLKY